MLREDIRQHTDKGVGVVEQLQNMGSKSNHAVGNGLHIVLIDVPELQAGAAAIKALSRKDVNWEGVSSRLIEEVNNLK